MVTLPEKNQVTPLALAGPSSRGSSSDEEDAAGRWPPARSAFDRRRWVQCCGCCEAMVAVAVAALLAVGFTVYKVRDPQRTMNAISLERMSIAQRNVRLTVAVDVSVKNRKPAAFYFDTNLTSLYGGFLARRCREVGYRA